MSVFDNNKMKPIAPMTSRKATRIRFLEQENDHLCNHKFDLERILSSTKDALNELFFKRPSSYSSSQQLEYSTEDTVSTNQITIKRVADIAADNLELFASVCKVNLARDKIDANVLINEQIAEESARKEEEALSELDEQINDLKYLLEKKLNRINILNSKIRDLEEQHIRIKRENTLLLKLSPENLALHKHLEDLKESLLNLSKELQFSDLQTQELKSHAKNLEIKKNKYILLSRNPILRSKKINYIQENSLDDIKDNPLEVSEID